VLDIQLVASAVVLLSITAPVLLFLATRHTLLRHLFVRPRWAHLQLPRRIAAQPA
jgi:hypothetical protein